MIKKLFILILSILVCSNTYAQAIDSIRMDGIDIPFYHCATDSADPHGLIIYLHGGVRLTKHLKRPVLPPIESLVEGNKNFIQVAQNAGYDIVLPTAFGEYNWLEEKGQRFLNVLRKKYAGTYKAYYIAGFSDGATGAYQVFHSQLDSFSGALVFNGFPQLGNFDQSIDRSLVKDKTMVFTSTTHDKTIPYEFPLFEYRKQKLHNANTIFHLVKGRHAFSDYTTDQLGIFLSYLSLPSQYVKPDSGKTIVYPAVNGRVVYNEVKEIYRLRSSTCRRYGLDKGLCTDDKDVAKYLGKMVRKDEHVSILPAQAESQLISKEPDFSFSLEVQGNMELIELKNWNYSGL